MSLKPDSLPDQIVSSLLITKIERNQEPPREISNNSGSGSSHDKENVRPYVILDKDPLSEDHVYWLLGCSATQVAEKVAKIAELICDGKI